MDFPEEIPGSGVEFLFRLLHNIIAATGTVSLFILTGQYRYHYYSLEFLTKKP
jgi:hypothetical protein